TLGRSQSRKVFVRRTFVRFSRGPIRTFSGYGQGWGQPGERTELPGCPTPAMGPMPLEPVPKRPRRRANPALRAHRFTTCATTPAAGLLSTHRRRPYEAARRRERALRDLDAFLPQSVHDRLSGGPAYASDPLRGSFRLEHAGPFVAFSAAFQQNVDVLLAGVTFQQVKHQ